MKILVADAIYSSKKIITKRAIAFDKTVVAIDNVAKLRKSYPDAEVIKLPKNSLVMPGLINAHVHLEFSANKTTLHYGDFLNWLYSVIENREELIASCHDICIKEALESMLASGITTIGAISSYAKDLQVCHEAKQNIIFFNELIGSNAAAADVLFEDFMQRLHESSQVTREGFFAAVAIHSPYSVHPILIQKALEVVQNNKLRLTAHFLESPHEKEWLEQSSGAFREFFEKLLQQKSAVTTPKEFLERFSKTKTLLTHGVMITEDEIGAIKKAGHTIIHCPISNRLLGNGVLDLELLEQNGVDWIVATDGLSSNYDLNLWEEMKIALFMHPKRELLAFATELLESVTSRAAKALDLPKGIIKEGYDADMIVLQLEDAISPQTPLHLILHQYPIIKRFILGKEI